MGRYRKFIDRNVYEEAKNRIKHIYETFDSVVVCFSGGKDSMVLLHLTKEVVDEMGINDGKVNVVYHDSEFLSPSVDLVVRRYANYDWVNMYWLSMRRHMLRFIMGKPHTYLEWDPDRENMRDIPYWAYTNEQMFNGEKLEPQIQSVERWTADQFPGNVCQMTGIRADESLTRYRASICKIYENYITGSRYRGGAYSMAKPIFDWGENDIFKYLYDNNITYSGIYNSQMWCKQKLRVADMVNAEAMKASGSKIMNELDQEYYKKAVEIFPDLADHLRYDNEVDERAQMIKYGVSFKGVVAWINDNIKEPPLLRAALVECKHVYGSYKNKPQHYPPWYVFDYFFSGMAFSTHGKCQGLPPPQVEEGEKKQAEIDKEHKEKYGNLYLD